MINRFSSRLQRLDHAFLRERLRDAKCYKRIAGYFRSSLFELVHEEIAAIDEVRVVCNSDLDPRDIGVARSIQQQAMALKEKWSERPPEADILLGRERYKRLHELLLKGNLKVRVVARDATAFLHGKAGVIESRNGQKTSFLGSGNETRQGWSDNYELLWEDSSKEAVAWVEDEFEYLWAQGVPLPDAIIEEIERCSRRTEFQRVEDCPEEKVAAAAMAEAPIYRRGEALMPWQQSFVSMFFDHRQTYNAARLLLADEVGLGKTLSLATSAALACLLGDGPALILCPATLTQQWQIELWDKLGVPAAVWTAKKTWLDHTGHHIRTRGPEDVVRCPYQIGIVSTGLIFHRTAEREHLLGRKFGTLVLDEAHRARRSHGPGPNANKPNNLLEFMLQAASKARHVLLGTATPIQTEISELWDLLTVLSEGADYVLGRKSSHWRHVQRSLDLLTGRALIEDEDDAWTLLRNPLPPGHEDTLFDYMRSDFQIAKEEFFSSRTVLDLQEETRALLKDRIEDRVNGLSFFQRHNPIVRHTVLRRRAMLEERGLLAQIAVDIHPNADALTGEAADLFDGLGLRVSDPIDKAYRAAERFTDLLKKRTRSAGFLKSLLLQRVCSSLASGVKTAERLLRGVQIDGGDDSEDPASTDALQALDHLTPAERLSLEELVHRLKERPSDPKFDAVCHYLLGEPGWLELGCIIFSQYYDTAAWIAESLSARIPGEPIAVYAGADRSGLRRDGQWVSVERDILKGSVRRRELRLVVATDAACEGLNLQTLGTLINVDLPWNPSRLEQRIGRIKRIGQIRPTVDMLNLVYQGTRDEKVYERLSQRMKDRYDLFGGLPDVIEDDWIEDIETLDLKLSEYIDKQRRATAFELRYSDTIDPPDEPWERCSQVLSRRDVAEHLSRGW